MHKSTRLIHFGNVQGFNCGCYLQVFKTDLYVGQIMTWCFFYGLLLYHTAISNIM